MANNDKDPKQSPQNTTIIDPEDYDWLVDYMNKGKEYADEQAKQKSKS